MISTSSSTTATAEARRPVAVVEELGPQRLADHQRFRAAQQIGNDELADSRNEDQQAAGKNAGQRQRECHLPERPPGARTQVFGRFEQ